MDGATVTETDTTLVEKNLAITGISLPDTDLDIGDMVRPDVRIANTGTEDAALAFGAGVWLSVDPVFDLEEDRLLSYFVYDPESIPLPAGAERDLFLYFDWTAEIAAEFASGTYHLIGAISYFEGTGDDRPDDDFFAVEVTVEGTGTPPPNEPPEAVDDMAETTQEDVVSIPVLANDSDPDGDTLTILGATQPANGSVSVIDGSIRFTPDAGFTGTTSFTYTIEDSEGATDTATVTVTVAPVEPNGGIDISLVPGSLTYDSKYYRDLDRHVWTQHTEFGAGVRARYDLGVREQPTMIQFSWILRDAEKFTSLEPGGNYMPDDIIVDTQVKNLPPRSEPFPTDGDFYSILFGNIGESPFANELEAGKEYLLLAIIDPVDALKETNENNNALVYGDDVGTVGVPFLISYDPLPVFDGTEGDDMRTGSDAAESFDMKAGSDIVVANGGDDFIRPGAGTDSVDGGAGFDTVSYAGAAEAVTAVLGGGALPGADSLVSVERIVGSPFGDRFVGGAADTEFQGGPGADTIDGGAGIDLASYFDSDAPVSVDLLAAVQSGGTAQGDRLTGIENVTGSIFDDTLAGDAGDNRLDGELGSDAIDGRGGRDTAPYQFARDGVTETVEPDGSVSVATVTGETDRLVSIERVELLDGAYLYDLAGADLPFVYRVYDAAFARTPDEAGLRFWAEKVGSGAVDLGALARAFVESPEFDTLFPSATDGEFIDALYANALRREPDDAGRTFWLDAFATGTLTRTDMLELFADSPENLIRNEDNYDDGVWVI